MEAPKVWCYGLIYNIQVSTPDQSHRTACSTQNFITGPVCGDITAQSHLTRWRIAVPLALTNINGAALKITSCTCGLHRSFSVSRSSQPIEKYTVYVKEMPEIMPLWDANACDCLTATQPIAQLCFSETVTLWLIIDIPAWIVTRAYQLLSPSDAMEIQSHNLTTASYTVTTPRNPPAGLNTSEESSVITVTSQVRYAGSTVFGILPNCVGKRRVTQDTLATLLRSMYWNPIEYD